MYEETYPVCSLSHKLLCGLFPDGRYGQHPADVLWVKLAIVGLVTQLLHGVLPEVAQSVLKHLDGWHLCTVGGRQLRVQIQILINDKMIPFKS